MEDKERRKEYQINKAKKRDSIVSGRVQMQNIRYLH